MSLKSIPSFLRPREKARRLGLASLSDVELLALLLRTGSVHHDALETAAHLLDTVQGLHGFLHVNEQQLMDIPGIHAVKALELQALIELHRRLSRVAQGDSIRIETPAHVFSLLQSECQGLHQETFYGLFLNARRQLIAYKALFTGTLNGTLVHPRDLFREAISRNSAYVVIAHNHPSGDVTPSEADRTLTKRLVDLGIELAIPVLDHVIIGHDRFYSLIHSHNDEMLPSRR